MPSNICDLFTARALVYFIMDDACWLVSLSASKQGGKGSSNETILHTRAFKEFEVKVLQNALKINFGLFTNLGSWKASRRQSNIIEKVTNQWIIIIPACQLAKQKTRLIDIVKSYMHDSMLYKN